MRKLLLPAFVALAGLALLASGMALAARGGGAGLGGSYQVDLNVQEDICGHDPFIFGSASHNMKLIVEQDEPGLIRILGPAPWVTVEGTKEGPFVQATGQGPVGPVSDAAVTFDGTIQDGVIEGKYVMGDPELGPQLPPCDPDGTPNPEGDPHPAIYTIKPKATPTPAGTPTPTPEEKFFSIIVLKLNNANNQPLEGWEFNLYAGNNCLGQELSSQETGERGLLDFTGLDPGKYSVEEKPQAGWNVVGDECQNVQVPNGGVAGNPCPIQPNEEFPQPGCDAFDSGARVIVEINSTGEEFPVNLRGPTLVSRINKPHKNADSLDEIDTEIVQLDLVGSSALGDVVVRQASTRSIGKITEQENTSGPGEMNFPADSFFDIFIEVDINIPGVGVVTLHNNEAFHMTCKIDDIPPDLCFYQPPIDNPIDLLNSDGVKVAKITHALHIPLPPKESILIFTNEEKATPTVTPTSTPTAASTPPPGTTATPTPTAATVPTVTPTSATGPTVSPTPRPCGTGDVNKNGTVNAIDVALILQQIAGLTDLVYPCNADVNEDGTVNAVDATLILQYIVGLIPALPV